MQTLVGDYCTMTSQAEISALKDALCAQQRLLQKLYNELEAEREASATAASEALNVILRLQGEKAAVKMEAEQYKRLAEEKMCHAEESFAIIEDIITQKEMEMSALDYQVQTYKYQLRSMGLLDPSEDDLDIPENLLPRKECLDNASLHHLGRMNSAPLLVRYKKAMLDRENSAGQEMMDFKTDEQSGHETNDNSVHGGMSSYAEQIRELEQRVKEIAGADYGSPSISSRPSATNLSSLSNSANLQRETKLHSPHPSIGNSDKVAVVNETNQIKHPENIPKKDEVVDFPCSSTVLDVFEVPQSEQDYELSNKDKKETACQTDEVLESKKCAQTEGFKLYGKDEPDWLKKLLHSFNNEKNLCKPSDIGHANVVHPTTSVSESKADLNKIARSSVITEEGREAESARREEELKLLKEIKEKLDLLQDEIKCQKVKESSMIEKPDLGPLPEAMLYFWL